MTLAYGESLIDMVPAPLGGETGYLPRPGGSPFNVAIGLGRIDAPVGGGPGLTRASASDEVPASADAPTPPRTRIRASRFRNTPRGSAMWASLPDHS